MPSLDDGIGSPAAIFPVGLIRDMRVLNHTQSRCVTLSYYRLTQEV